MKRFKLVMIICFLTFAVSCGQQKRYVSYKIKEGENMRDIAKRLDMKTKDLLRLNPDVGRRPEANTVIIIPNPKKTKASTSMTTKEASTEVDETVVATTSKNSGTTEVSETITTNQPNSEELAVLKKNFVIHIAKPKETVYGLKRFYNVPLESIYKLNPGLKENGLKIGQIVKIKSIVAKEAEEASEEIIEIYQDYIDSDVTLNVAYLLPFRASKYDSVAPVDIFKGKGSRLVNMTTDFYMGARIAIDSLEKQGVNIKATVLDTGKKGANISTIISEGKLKNADVIIGPFYSDKAQQVAHSVKVPVVFPHYSKNQAQFSSGKIVKTVPDTNSNTQYLIEYLKENYNGETIFVVGDGKSKSNAQVNAIVAGLQKHDSISEVHVLKPKTGYIKKERFTDKMKPKTHSWVVMTANDNVAVADALNSMVVLPEEVTVQVFAVAKNEAYDKIDNNKLARVNLAYVTNSYIDEKAEVTKSFDAMYRKKNYTLPSDYAIKGFDVTYDILMRMASGDSLSSTFKKGASLRIESKYDYDKTMFGATGNNGLFIVKYNEDLTLERLK